MPMGAQSLFLQDATSSVLQPCSVGGVTMTSIIEYEEESYCTQRR